MRTVAVILAVLWLTSAVAFADTDPPPPPPPSNEIPAVDSEAVEIECIDCRSGAFTLTDHNQALEELLEGGLVSNEMLAELRKAMYWQDIVHQFESKAHFDNCAFAEGADYVAELLAETDTHVKEAMAHRDANRPADAGRSARAAFATLGQAMHAIQDFYAHSNYIEIHRDQGVVRSAIPIVPVWTPKGRETLLRLKKDKGLHSGKVWWGVPKYCEGGESHHDLNKDSAGSPRGSQHVAQWENLTLHRAARQLASLASTTFLKYAYRRWPYLPEVAGQRVLFDVFQDRRGL